MMRTAVVGIIAILISGCDRTPEHYYVLCEDKDYNGWNLVGTEYDGGYLMACTYQSPDKLQSYTARCRSEGCD